MDGGPPSASARLTHDREAWAQRSRRMECCEPAASASIGQDGVIIRRHHHHRHYTPPPTAALLANPALPVIDYQAVPPRTPGLFARNNHLPPRTLSRSLINDCQSLASTGPRRHNLGTAPSAPNTPKVRGLVIVERTCNNNPPPPYSIPMPSPP